MHTTVSVTSWSFVILVSLVHFDNLNMDLCWQSIIPGRAACLLLPGPDLLIPPERAPACSVDPQLDVYCSAAMNELTWRRVLEWEALHHDTCGDPKLLRFMGKPHDLRYESSTCCQPS